MIEGSHGAKYERIIRGIGFKETNDRYGIRTHDYKMKTCCLNHLTNLPDK